MPVEIRCFGYLRAAWRPKSAMWFLLGIASVLSAPSISEAADLTIGLRTIQNLVSTQLFKQQGRWYLLDNGPCYAYLENPQTRLAGGRLLVDAHLSSRMGVRFGGYCAGSGFASNITLSGRLVGNGSALTLDDIRIDRIEDSVTSAIVNLIRQAAPQLLPRALSFDVLTAVHGAPVAVSGVPVTLTKFHIDNLATIPSAVIVSFDLSLSTP
jgi:hypothetical protein